MTITGRISWGSFLSIPTIPSIPTGNRRMCRLPRSSFILALFVLPLFFQPCNAEYIFSAPPREDPEKGKETYGPLVNYLSFVLGEKVVYEHPAGWAEYANNMRSGHYDIVFDGPHFGAWRMKNISHVPVASLPGTLGFVVVSKKSNKRISKVKDLLTVEICGLASPNLGTMTVYNLFNNPVLSPRLFEVKGGFAGVYRALRADKCQAAVLRNTFYHKLDPREKEELLVVTATKPIPNQTITIGHRLSAKKQLISNKLTSKEGKKAAANLLKRFGGFPNSLHYAQIQEYENLENLLTGVVWGW